MQTDDGKITAASAAENLRISPKNGCSCDSLAVGRLEPCTLVIFGASGDLATRKLIPALFKMFVAGSLPGSFAIVGCGRTEMSGEEFHNRLKGLFEKQKDFDGRHWRSFASCLHYHPLGYTSESFRKLAAYLRDLDKTAQTDGNYLFHLAVPPTLYGVIGELLGEAGLSHEKREGKGWTRIVVEKPFGHNLQTAVELDTTLHRSFEEHQIFRIDHYLAKETVQNVLMLRFANAIFEPLWNRNFIDYVGIVAAESLGIEQRAGYYEKAGVIRDMFQNHMLQLLSLTAMEPPARFEADRVRDEKVKVFQAIRPFSLKPDDNLVLGQYEDGNINGAAVPGYRGEEGVNPKSLTPTFAMMRLFVDNWRWKGVPFHLISGKRLQRKVTRIVIQFKDVPHTLFENVLAEHITANRLEMGIYPEEAIRLSFQTKNPGPRLCLKTMAMDFEYSRNYQGSGFDPYAKVLLDCILGDQMLFWRQDGVEASWGLLSPILDDCEQCRGRGERLHPYAAGSWGPELAADQVKKIIGHDH